MKTLLTILTLTASVVSGFSQFTLVNPIDQSKEIVIGDFEYIDMYIRNDGASDATYVWEEVSNTLPSDWDYSICDYETCYVNNETSGEMKPVGPGTEIAFVKPNVMASSVGSGTVTYKVYEKSTPGTSETFSFTFTAFENNQVAVDENEAQFDLFPNPASSILNISTIANNFKLELIDITGKVIISKNYNQNNISLNVEDYSAGIYFVKITKENFTEVKKINITH